MSSNRFTLLAFFGLFLVTICGSALGSKIGLNGLAQWPVAGFAVGLLLASQMAVVRLAERVKALEDKIAGSKIA